MPDLKLLFLQMMVILAADRLLPVASRFVGQPAMVGEMVAGILLGPCLLGRISPASMNSLFPSDGLRPQYALSQLGLVLFMFMVGLEIRPDAIRGSAKSVIVTSQASIAAPFLCGGLLGWNLYPRLAGSASRLSFVLFLGAAMGITAFPVLARIRPQNYEYARRNIRDLLRRSR
jgi:Kef-type K+ transport system membrane component KefB